MSVVVAPPVPVAHTPAERQSLRGATILVAHNHYQQPGGEDEVVRSETALLRSHGHIVHEYRVHNADIEKMGRAALLRATIWNRATAGTLGAAVASRGTRVAHFHNTFPLISPAGYQAARDQGLAVVQTLHNYRLLCPGSMFLRDGQLCEQCLGRRVSWPAVVHGCYRGSRTTTAAVTGMLAVHRTLGTYRDAVDVYIALTEFARQKFIEGGLPAEKIVVKPNFASDPGVGRHDDGTALFVGRLIPDKGIDDLVAAWRLVVAERPQARLRIIGDGPSRVLERSNTPGLEWLGWQSRERVTAAMLDAALLVFPSRQREGFPMTIVEAFAAGLPVVTSRFEMMQALVRDEHAGRLYRHGDPADLANVLTRLLDDKAACAALGRGARAEYTSKYTPEANYEQLIAIYELAARGANSRGSI